MAKPKAPVKKRAQASSAAVSDRRLASKGTAQPDGAHTEIVGQPGFQQYGGFVQDDVLRELIGQRARTIYREMADNDATVGALIFAFSTLMRAAKWEVQPVDESSKAEEAAEFLKDVLFKDMGKPWGDVIDDAASELVYGFAVQEIIWKRREKDNRIGIDSLSPRSQHTIWQWTFDEKKDFAVTGAVQQPYSGMQVTIPVDKLVLHKTQPQRGNPEGRSILRSAYRSWSMKKRLENIEGVGMERDLAGLPVMKVPAGMLDPKADPEQRTALQAYKTLVKRIRRDSQEGIVLPSSRDQNGHLMYELELLSTGGTRAFDTTKILDRYGKAIAMSTLADFIYLGQQSVGSFALSSDKTELFGVAVGGFLTGIENNYNRQLIPRLWAYNALDPEVMPILKHGDVEQTSLAEVVSVINTIISGGGILDRETENAMRTRAGLPLLPEEGLEDQGAVDDDAQRRRFAAYGGKPPGEEDEETEE
jgi:hypothetical protein